MTTQSTTEELVARFQHFTFRSEDGDLVVARVVQADGKPATARGNPEAGPRMQRDGTYRFHGKWEDHERFGRQFAFVSFSAVVVGDRAGVIAYLTGVAENVGEKRAAALWERYGPLAVESLRENPQAVAEAGVMPLAEAEAAAESLRREVAFEVTRIELLSLLNGRGFQLGRLIPECLARMGRRAPEMIREDPYRLLLGNYPSCGWKRCDRLYLDLGRDASAIERQALCAVFHLREQAQGDTWLSVEQVGSAVAAAIGGKADPTEAILHARNVLHLLTTHRDASGKVWVAEGRHADDERIVASRLKELIQWQPKPTDSNCSDAFAGLLLDVPVPTSD